MMPECPHGQTVTHRIYRGDASTLDLTPFFLGDFAPVDFDPTKPGVQTRLDDIGNVIQDPNAPQVCDDTLNDSAANDDIAIREAA